MDRTSNAGLAAELANHLTVYNVDRRGRGDSGDTLPYALQREIEDIAAVMEVAGGHAHLYGTSSRRGPRHGGGGCRASGAETRDVGATVQHQG